MSDAVTYVIFSYLNYYPSGGVADIIGGPAPTSEEAILEAAEHKYGVSHYVHLIKFMPDEYEQVASGDGLRKLIRRAKEEVLNE